MYICNCNGVTEREIAGAVELGCATVADLGRELGVATCCGKCLPEAARLLDDCRSRRTPSAAQPPGA